MDRPIVYPAAIPLESDLLHTARDAMCAIGSAMSLVARFDGGQVYADGLICLPTGPASMSVILTPGRAYAGRVVDVTPYGTLPADSDVIARSARTDGAVFVLTPPQQAGTAVRYLVQATVSEVDAEPVVLPYYNAANPAQGYSGPENSGVPQMTRRLSTVSLQLKVGLPAVAGSEAAPPVDAGWIGLAEVQVRNGDFAIDSTRIFNRGDGRLPKLNDLATVGSLSIYATVASLIGEGNARAAADAAEAQARTAADAAEAAARFEVDTQLARRIAEVERDENARVDTLVQRVAEVEADVVARVAGLTAGLDTDFAHGFNGDGYGWQKLRGGLILQWGQGSIPASGQITASGTANFPIAFPHGCLTVVATLGGTGHLSAETFSNTTDGFQPTLSVTQLTPTAFRASTDNLSPGQGSGGAGVATNRNLGFNYIAVGT